MTFGRITALLGGITAVLILLIFLFPDMRWILPISAAQEATGIDGLFRLMIIVSIAIFVFVQGFLLYFVWLFRQKPDEDPEAVGSALHGDNRLELAWTVAPALFLVILTILSLQVYDDLDLGESVPRVVDVTAQQFFWNFNHPETGIRETGTLTLEKGVPVTLVIGATDVNHAFWVPEFRIKQDATPGFIRRVTVTPTMTHLEAGYDGEEGRTFGFPLRCAEFCGAGHSGMFANVLVLEPEEYAAWEAEEVAAREAGGVGGAALYTAQGCGGCHVLDAAGAQGVVGPTHNDLAAIAAERIAAPDYSGSATTPAEYIAESIRNPAVYVVEGYANVMPPYGEAALPDDQLELMVEYLLDPN